MLTVNHLAPYLPYGLKLQTTNPDIVELETLSTTSINIKGNTWVYGSYCDIEDVKPILRPMSDLTKGILIEAGFTSHIDYLTHELQNPSNYSLLDGNGNRLWRIECAPYEMVQFLFENHFDVFGLIDQGLAISIHDISKTEK